MQTTFLRSLLAFSLFFSGMTAISAQKYSNEFLSIGVGARAQALGNAVVASTDDVYAGVWNPAGLAALPTGPGLQIAAMHSEWFGGVGKFDYLGITLPLANPGHRLAFSLIRFGIDGIPNTLSLYESDGSINFDNVTEFSAADYAFLISYARPFKAGSPFRMGGSVKIIHRRIGPFATAWGFGLDAGLQYQKGRFRWGVVARDLTSTFNAWSFSFTETDKETLQLTGNEVPINSVETTKPQLLLGAAYEFRAGSLDIRPEVNFVVTTDGKRNTLISSAPFSIDPAFGVEADYNDFIYLRAGVNQFQKELDFDGSENLNLRPSVGLGLRISSLLVDYAYTDLGDERNTFSHIISLKLDIKPRKS